MYSDDSFIRTSLFPANISGLLNHLLVRMLENSQKNAVVDSLLLIEQPHFKFPDGVLTTYHS